MAAGASTPIVGTNGKITLTLGAATSQGFFVGDWEVAVEVKTEETGPWIGNPNTVDIPAGRKITFKLSGHVSPTGEDADSDAFVEGLQQAYFVGTEPDTLVFDTIKGSKFTFAKATTTYSKYTYKQEAKGGVTFEAEGSGIPTVAAGSAS